MKIIIAELDFTKVTKNDSVKAQGVVTCIYSDSKGWFSPKFSRFVSRQDLAVILNEREVEL